MTLAPPDITMDAIIEGVSTEPNQEQVRRGVRVGERETGKQGRQDSFGVTMAWYPAGIVGI